MINIDYQSRTPIYEQIVEEIEKYVALNLLRPNDKLPAIRELAVDLAINPNTVKKAYEILENKGVIISISTKGTFIKDNVSNVVEYKVEEKINSIKNIMRELNNMGISNNEIINKIK